MNLQSVVRQIKMLASLLQSIESIAADIPNNIPGERQHCDTVRALKHAIWDAVNLVAVEKQSTEFSEIGENRQCG